ncbi:MULTISPECIES: SPOR domain-containing protein [unclassified Microbacterium]|uniref:SPOR domain-containing protein n=1 Tax=unclassified Microbacterium TaxID=2609290 RepID=UPI000EA86B22|nr:MULTISPECIES: SPOR domain-containing protein [unclassified Microbacterium]MBT2486071.1 SPOR domain-containing protein [Microbacterium sp. ISL-108]RKN68806.1 SPOR domain-containing protein [Microbacterium sp. CGR2]
MSDGDHKYWYNLETGQVEFGMISPSVDRVGPFDTQAEAARAPEVLKERSRAWAEEEAAEQGWDAKGQGAKGQGAE